MAPLGGKRVVAGNSRKDSTVIMRGSESSLISKGQKVACDLAYVGKRLLKSTGKAAWISVTTFIVLGIPLIFALEHEQQFRDLGIQEKTLLGVGHE